MARKVPVFRGREFWRGAVRDWRRSGETQSEFADRHGLAASTLSRWVGEFRDDDDRVVRTAASGAFVEVVGRSEGTGTSRWDRAWVAAARLTVGGAVIEFATLPPAEYVAVIGIVAGRSQ